MRTSDCYFARYSSWRCWESAAFHVQRRSAHWPRAIERFPENSSVAAGAWFGRCDWAAIERIAQFDQPNARNQHIVSRCRGIARRNDELIVTKPNELHEHIQTTGDEGFAGKKSNVDTFKSISISLSSWTCLLLLICGELFFDWFLNKHYTVDLHLVAMGIGGRSPKQEPFDSTAAAEAH